MSKANLLPQGGLNRCVLAREGYVLYNTNDKYVGQAIERYGEFSDLEAQLCLPRSSPHSVEGMDEVTDPTRHPMQRHAPPGSGA